MAPARSIEADAFTITPVGTCRLAAPIRLSAAEFGLAANRKRIYGYSHSISETVQQVRFLQGDYRPDPAIWHVIGNGDLSDKLAEAHEASDVYIVELSSLKQISVDGHAIQLNYLKSRYIDFFKDPQRSAAFWTAAEAGDSAGLREMLNKARGAVGLGPDEIHLLSRIRLRFSDESELVEKLGEVRDRLINPIIVTHVDALDSAGEKLRLRSACISQVEAAASTLGLQICNPTSLMEAFGQDSALEKHSDSLAHFSDAFSQSVFAAWHEKFLAKRFDDRIALLPNAKNLSRYRRHIEATASSGKVDEVFSRLDALAARVPGSAEEFTALYLDLRSQGGAVNEAHEAAVQAVQSGASSKSVLTHALRLGVRQNDVAFIASTVARVLEQNLASNDESFIAALSVLAKANKALAARGLEGVFLNEGFLIRDAFEIFARIALEKPDSVDGNIARAAIRQEAGAIDPIGLTRLILKFGGDMPAHIAKLFSKRGPGTAQAIALLDARGYRDLIIQAIDSVQDDLPQDELERLLSSTFDRWETSFDGPSERTEEIRLAHSILRIGPRRKAARRVMRRARESCLLEARTAYRELDAEALRALMNDAARLLPRLDEAPYFLSRLLYAAEDYKGAKEASELATAWSAEKQRNWAMLLRASFRAADFIGADCAARRIVELAKTGDDKFAIEANDRLAVLPGKALSAARKEDDPLRAFELLKIAERNPELKQSSKRPAERATARAVREMRRMEKEARPEAAMDYARQALPLIEGRIAGLISVARTFFRAREYAAALPLWERIVEAEPDIEKWRKMLDQCRIKAGVASLNEKAI